MYCKKTTFIIFLVLISFSGLAQGDIIYSSTTIADSLKKSANAVIRFEKTIFELKGIDKATKTVESVITILNKNAISLSYFIQPYDQFSKIKNINGIVYDAEGKLVKKIKKEDIMDISANFGGSLFVDSRLKLIDPEYLKYPFTVEYSYEIEYDGLLNYPDWSIYRYYDVSIEKSIFTVIRPGHLNIRTYNKDLDIIPAQKVEDEKVILTWQVQNVKALSKEPFSEELNKLSPSVLFAPTDFLIDGYQGNAETWENFGKWIYTLNEGKRNLSPETQQKIYSLIKDKNSNIEKAQILYEYLQDKTRYVSVQVGIGGWQPIEADQVDRLSYGDCKALTNYMKALLDIAGIPSYYTLVRAGRNSPDIISDFPSNQFNHAILCTLIDNDTVWLECTSQRMPFGYIGSFTDDREVVLINEKGGNLVRTKVYTYDENQKNCKANIEIDMEGNLSCSVNTGYKGMFYDEKLKVMLSDDYDMEKLIREKLHLPNFSMQSFDLEENHDFHPSIDLSVQLSVNGYGKKFGNRMAINLNLLNKLETVPASKEFRHSNIIAKRSYIENDTVNYIIPEGYQVEKTSSNRNVQSEFGEFKSTITVEGSNIQYIRYLKINKGVFPPEQYDQFSEFYAAVKQGDEDRVILMSK